jgi:hypothetical protein
MVLRDWQVGVAAVIYITKGVQVGGAAVIYITKGVLVSKEFQVVASVSCPVSRRSVY